MTIAVRIEGPAEKGAAEGKTLKYPVHELSYIFPPMGEDEYLSLVGGMVLHGYDKTYPITVWRGYVVDGRHRQAAAADAGVTPEYNYLSDELEGKEVKELVVQRNARHRHMNTGQKATVAAELSLESRYGGDRKSEQYFQNQGAILHLDFGVMSLREASKEMGVSERTTKDARKILMARYDELFQPVNLDEADPRIPVEALYEQMKRGDIAPSKAVEELEQLKRLREADKRAEQAEKEAKEAERRAEREVERRIATDTFEKAYAEAKNIIPHAAWLYAAWKTGGTAMRQRGWKPEKGIEPRGEEATASWELDAGGLRKLAQLPHSGERIADQGKALLEYISGNAVSLPGAVLAVIRAEAVEKAKEVPEDEQFRLLASPVKEMPRHVQAGSLDAVITDPPYGQEAIVHYRELAEFAVHALRPGGGLYVMTGQMFLPEIMDALEHPGLQYRWTSAFFLPHGGAAWGGRQRVSTSWKPILMYTRTGAQPDQSGVDVMNAQGRNANDKMFHEWGQDLGGFAQLLEQFVQPESVICDPFVGSGTTLVAAKRIGTYTGIGSDINPEEIEITRKRLSDDDGEIS